MFSDLDEKLILNEKTRSWLINRAKQGKNYKNSSQNRFDRSKNSQVANQVKNYNHIDMNKFFKEDVLDVKIPVNGETDDYEVRVSFDGTLERIQKEMQGKDEKEFTFAVIMRALKNCFQSSDVRIFCDCKDWNFRIGYWASVNNYIAGEKENIPSDETNPDDNLGSLCKHAVAVLRNNSWVNKVASTIHNYYNYMKLHDNYKKAYEQLIYPKIFGHPFEEEELASDSDTIDDSNKEAAERSKFKDQQFRWMTKDEEEEYYKEHPEERDEE